MIDSAENRMIPIDFHRIICKIEQHVRRVLTDVIACPQSVAIDSSPGVSFVFLDVYDVFFRELIVSMFHRHLFSMSCHERVAVLQRLSRRAPPIFLGKKTVCWGILTRAPPWFPPC